jgi:hypothetical protein
VVGVVEAIFAVEDATVVAVVAFGTEVTVAALEE